MQAPTLSDTHISSSMFCVTLICFDDQRSIRIWFWVTVVWGISIITYHITPLILYLHIQNNFSIREQERACQEEEKLEQLRQAHIKEQEARLIAEKKERHQVEEMKRKEQERKDVEESEKLKAKAQALEAALR